MGRFGLRRRPRELSRLDRLRLGLARRDRTPSRTHRTRGPDCRAGLGCAVRPDGRVARRARRRHHGVASSRCSASDSPPTRGRSASPECRSPTTSLLTRTRWRACAHTTARCSAARQTRCPIVISQSSPITYVDDVKAPVFISAGANDPRCPIRQIDNYVERLRERGADFSLYQFDAGHGSLVVEERIRQTEAQLNFARAHLGMD